MNKPELLVTPVSIHDILPLIEAGADAFLVGEQRYGLRLAGDFSREDIKKAVEIAHEHGKKVYVAMNALFHNDKLPELPQYLQFLTSIGVDAVTFGDPCCIACRKRSGTRYEAALEHRNDWNKLVYM